MYLPAPPGAFFIKGRKINMGKLREFFDEAGCHIESAKLALLAIDALDSKREVMSEASFVRRIEAMIRNKEIQFTAKFPLDEPDEPIDVRYARIPGFGEKGRAIYLVIKKGWIDEKTSSENREQGLEEMYDWLKALLGATDYLRSQGEVIITGPEIEATFAK